MRPLAFAVAFAGLTATTALAQVQGDNVSVVFDYPTMSGMNEGLTQARFNEFDSDADGILNPDEQMAFIDAGYTNETPVEMIAEPTDGIATD